LFLFCHKTCKTFKTCFSGRESGQPARFPAATRLGAAALLSLGFVSFVGFVII